MEDGGTKERWRDFNKLHILQEEWEKTNKEEKNTATLQQTIINSMKNTIGTITVTNNRKQKISNPKIIYAKAERKKTIRPTLHSNVNTITKRD